LIAESQEGSQCWPWSRALIDYQERNLKSNQSVKIQQLGTSAPSIFVLFSRQYSWSLYFNTITTNY
jgi:hypothetical protein